MFDDARQIHDMCVKFLRDVAQLKDNFSANERMTLLASIDKDVMRGLRYAIEDCYDVAHPCPHDDDESCDDWRDQRNDWREAHPEWYTTMWDDKE